MDLVRLIYCKKEEKEKGASNKLEVTECWENRKLGINSKDLLKRLQFRALKK